MVPSRTCGCMLFLVSLPIMTSAVEVTYNNFAEIETGKQFERYQKFGASTSSWMHLKTPTPLDKQTTIRMNRDTLYSFAIVNVKDGATITLPKSGGRYMSLMVVNQFGYTNKVWYGGGTIELARDVIGSDHAAFVVRTLINSNNPADVAEANAMQDKFSVVSKATQPFVLPKVDESSYQAMFKSLAALFKLAPDTAGMFGTRAVVDPIRFLLGNCGGFGGLPQEDAFYLLADPSLPAAEYRITYKDVPVDGFWSLTIYDKDGFMFASKGGVPNLNSLNAKQESDGSYVLHLGGCEDGRLNCLGLVDGWNYALRLYRPKPAILSGEWKPQAFVAIGNGAKSEL